MSTNVDSHNKFACIHLINDISLITNKNLNLVSKLPYNETNNLLCLIFK